MATVATVQVLVDEDDDESIKTILRRLSVAAKSVPGVHSMRITDAHGYILGTTTATVRETEQVVFKASSFVLPVRANVTLDPREAGTFKIRIQRGVEDPETIEVNLTVSANDVAVELGAVGAAPLISKFERRVLSFVEAENLRQIHTVGQQPYQPGMPIDYATNMPVAGVVMLVPALAVFDSWERLPNGRLHFKGLAFSETFEAQAFPYQTVDPASGNRSYMFYNRNMEMISEGRLAIERYSNGDDQHGGPDATG